MQAPQGVLGLFLLLGGSIMAGYLGHCLFQRHRISDILVLLLVGLLAGPILGIVDPAILAPALPFLAPMGLAIVLFEGGLDLGLDELRRNGGRAIALTLAVWGLTVVAVALATIALFGFAPSIAVLFGVAVAATGILGVVPLLAAIRAPAKARVLLTVETSLGDLLSAVATTTLAGVLVLGLSPWVGLSLFTLKFLVGASVGVLAGLAWSRALHALGPHRNAFALTLAALLVAYVAAETLLGSGFLMALAFGLVVGNAAPLRRLGLHDLAMPDEQARLHQSEIIFILRSVYFVFLGLSVSRSILAPWMLAAGVAIVGAMALARGVAVWLVTRRDASIDGPSRILLVGMMPRGLATAVIAGIPVAMGVPGTEGFLGLTFLVIVGADVATTLGLFAYRRKRDRATRSPSEAPAAPRDASSH